MAAHLEVKTGGGGQDPPTNTKKKFKFNRKTMLLVGGVGVVILVLVMSLMRKPSTATDTGNYAVGTPGMQPGGYPSGGSDGYGSNSADMAAQMQTIQDSLTSEVQSIRLVVKWVACHSNINNNLTNKWPNLHR